VLASGVAEAVADPEHDVLLQDSSLAGGGDRLGQALEPVAGGDQHIFHAPVLQLGKYL
jgi:hypothetical protein